MKLFDQIAVGAVAGTTILTGALYERLPARIPTHFDHNGVANGWMGREVGAWLLPVTALTIWILLRFGERVMPRAWAVRMVASPMFLVASLFALLLSALQCVILYAALETPPNVGASLAFVFGVFWTGLGLVMPKIQRNPLIGVRTPWTLASDENWARTHRMAGYAFVIAGILALVAVLLGHASVAFAFIALSALVPVSYSFALARRLPPES